VFAQANDAVLTDAAVETTETSRDEAEKMGAIAFFGDKYGSSVRVVQSGPGSLEFCGGTHVGALGQIGPITLLSGGSIGSNTRRLFALTGKPSLARAVERDHLVHEVAELLRSEPEELVAAVTRVMERQREAEKELARLRQQSSESEAATLAAGSTGGIVVARRDKLEGDALRSLAQAVLRHEGMRAVVLGGSPDGEKAAIAAATGGTPDATQLVRTLGAMVGGGGGGSAEVALAGGKDPSGIDAALDEAQRLLSA
jgi:alanyl-tRNA synthetase